MTKENDDRRIRDANALAKLVVQCGQYIKLDSEGMRQAVALATREGRPSLAELARRLGCSERRLTAIATRSQAR